MRVISFYTSGTRYEADAMRLRESCDRFGFKHDIRPLAAKSGDAPPDATPWISVVGRKPEFIRDMLLEHRSPVCWMDADCTIMQDPVLLRQTRADLAMYNFLADPMNEAGEYSPDKLWGASGVVYLAFTPRIMRLVNEWCDQIEAAPWIVDDHAISWVYNHFRGGKINTQWLPRAYNRMSEKWPQVEPIIDHRWKWGMTRER